MGCGYNYWMIRDILDETDGIRAIFDELRANFYSGATRSAEFRKNALTSLLEGYKQLQGQFDIALKADLGHNSFIANMQAHSLTKTQIQDLTTGVSAWMKPESVPTPMGLGWASCAVQYEPLGVALVISAWNYPIYTAIPQVAAAIAAGNCVILKPSELAAESSGVIKKLFDQYMDKRFFRVIEGRVEVAKTVTRLPVDVICFTGSTQTGRLVAIQAAKNLVPCILELGGKCPVIVDETAKISPAINRILFGKFFNCGQTCIGVDHIFVHESLKESFRTQLLQTMTLFYEGDQSLEQDGNYGKIINRFHMDRIEKLLRDDHGGRVIYGGRAIDKESRFIGPIVVECPKMDSLMMQEQIFGPILPLHYYNDLQELVRDIASRPKPLVVYHFSESKANIRFVKERTYSGAYVVNDTVVQMTNLHLPFGGVGGSGYGRFHGRDGFVGFSNPKSVAHMSSMDNFPTNQRYPPYTAKKQAMLAKLLKMSSVTYGQIARGALVLLLLVAVVLMVVLIPKW